MPVAVGPLKTDLKRTKTSMKRRQLRFPKGLLQSWTLPWLLAELKSGGGANREQRYSPAAACSDAWAAAETLAVAPRSFVFTWRMFASFLISLYFFYHFVELTKLLLQFLHSNVRKEFRNQFKSKSSERFLDYEMTERENLDFRLIQIKSLTVTHRAAQ